MRQNYGGAVVEVCLATFAAVWGNPNNLLRAFGDDLLLNLLFSVIPYRETLDKNPREVALQDKGPFGLVLNREEEASENNCRQNAPAGTSPNGESSLSLSYRLPPAGSIVKWVKGALQYRETDGREEKVTIELYSLSDKAVPSEHLTNPLKRVGVPGAPLVIVSVEAVPVAAQKKGELACNLGFLNFPFYA